MGGLVSFKEVNPFCFAVVRGRSVWSKSGWRTPSKIKDVVISTAMSCNMAHQACQAGRRERTELFGWIAQVEFGNLRVAARPDLCVLLAIPPQIAQH